MRLSQCIIVKELILFITYYGQYRDYGTYAAICLSSDGDPSDGQCHDVRDTFKDVKAKAIGICGAAIKQYYCYSL